MWAILLAVVGIILVVLWARRDSGKRLSQPGAEPEENAHENLPKPIEVSSVSGDGSYTVDTAALTCTCPDFQQQRSGFTQSDPRRLCKHLLSQIDEYSIFDIDTAMEISDASSGGGFPIMDRFTKKIGGDRCAVHIPPNRKRPWVSVYMDQTRFGFNVEERRWSYENEPSNRRILESWILQLWTQPSELKFGKR